MFRVLHKGPEHLHEMWEGKKSTEFVHMRLFTVSQQFELSPQSPCPQSLMDQRKRSKAEEDQEQRKWPRWRAWKKGKDETYNRTDKEKQFLDMNEVQQELDLLQDKDHTGKDDQTIEDKHKEEVQKVEEEDQKVEEEDQKEEEEVQKEEEEIQTGWVNYHEQTSTYSSSSGDAKKNWQGGKVWVQWQGDWWLQPKEGSTWWQKWKE